MEQSIGSIDDSTYAPYEADESNEADVTYAAHDANASNEVDDSNGGLVANII